MSFFAFTCTFTLAVNYASLGMAGLHFVAVTLNYASLGMLNCRILFSLPNKVFYELIAYIYKRVYVPYSTRLSLVEYGAYTFYIYMILIHKKIAGYELCYK